MFQEKKNMEKKVSELLSLQPRIYDNSEEELKKKCITAYITYN